MSYWAPMSGNKSPAGPGLAQMDLFWPSGLGYRPLHYSLTPGYGQPQSGAGGASGEGWEGTQCGKEVEKSCVCVWGMVILRERKRMGDM